MAYLGNSSTTNDPTRTSPAPRDADRFSGNGSTTSFTLSRAVSLETDIEVFVENVQQEPITAYSVNQTALTFTGAPPSGTNNVYVVYRNFQSGAQVTVPDGSITYNKLANNIRIFTTDNLTPNGNNSVFTLSEPPADANTVMVTVDGVIQRAPVHYTTSGSTITFTSNPPAGSNVHVRHLGFRTTTTVTQLAANSTITNPVISGSVTGGATFQAPTINAASITGNTAIPNGSQLLFNSASVTFDIKPVTGAADNLQLRSIYSGTTYSGIQMDYLGRVTKSLQPAFSAYGYSASSGYFSNQYIGNVTLFNTGSHYSTSTKRFTAPVTGIYYFAGGALKYNNSNTGWVGILVNGGATPSWGQSYGEGANGNESLVYAGLVQLNAGDYAQLYAYSNASSGYYDGGNSPYNWFAGYLLG